MKPLHALFFTSIALLQFIDAEELTTWSCDKFIYEVETKIIKSCPKYDPLNDKAPPITVSLAAQIAYEARKKSNKNAKFVISDICLLSLDVEGDTDPITGELLQRKVWYYDVRVSNTNSKIAMDELMTGKDTVKVFMNGLAVKPKPAKQ